MKIKRVSALLLVLCLLFSMQMTIFALESPGIVGKNDKISLLENAVGISSTLRGFVDFIPLSSPETRLNFNEEWKKIQKSIERNKTVQAQNIRVHFIDVGQGDSIFVELSCGESLLIDAGNSKNVTADYISSLGYKSISCVLVTHADADHITGMPEVLRRFSVGDFYLLDKEHTTNAYSRLIDALDSNKCSVKSVVSGQTIINSGGTSAVILAPLQEYTDNNYSSVVVKLTNGENTFLFTGDIGHQAENDILKSGVNISADVIKVSHHGAEGASSAEFVEKVAPKYAIISVGADNPYGHPDAEVLNLFKSLGIQILRTDKSGTIIIDSDGIDLTINCTKSDEQTADN